MAGLSAVRNREENRNCAARVLSQCPIQVYIVVFAVIIRDMLETRTI